MKTWITGGLLAASFVVMMSSGRMGAVVSTTAHAETAFGADDVNVCHIEGNGDFLLISIDGHALAAHLDHGDGQPGGPVPGAPGKQFDPSCNQIDVCPPPCLPDQICWGC